MIDINLVPQQMRKKRRGGGLVKTTLVIPKEAIVGLIGGFVALLLVVHVVLQVVITVKFFENKRYTHRLAAIATEKTNVDNVIQQLKTLHSQLAEYKKVTGGGDMSWAQKLYEISVHLPRGVWLRRMALNDNTLLIEGSAVSKNRSEMISVHNFTLGLKDSKDFMRHVKDIELGTIRARTVAGTPVADFTMRVKLKKK